MQVPFLVLSAVPTSLTEDIQACLVFAHHSVAGEKVYERMTIRPSR